MGRRKVEYTDHVSWDRQKERWQYVREYHKPLQPHIGKVAFKKSWPKGEAYPTEEMIHEADREYYDRLNQRTPRALRPVLWRAMQGDKAALAAELRDTQAELDQATAELARQEELERLRAQVAALGGSIVIPDVSTFVRFSYAEIVGAWVKGREGTTAKKSREGMESKMKRLAGFLHDRDHRKIKTNELAEFDASPITTDDLLRYRVHLLDLKERGLIEPKTVEDHVSMLRQLFRAAYGAGLKSNPADDDRFNYQGQTRRENKRNIGFTAEERRTIYLKCRDAEPIVKFMNLAGLWWGPRNAEIAELTTYDIEECGTDGLPVCHIREDNRPSEQRLKVEEFAPRPLPIPVAWAAWAIAHRDAVIAQHGHGPLFPDVPLDADKRRNDNATNIVNKWLKEALAELRGDGKVKTFYYHRHTFKTLARGAMETETHDAITGHAGGNAGRGYGYHPMEIMRAGIEHDNFNAVTKPRRTR